MRLLLNAWLERYQPQLRITDLYTGLPVLELAAHQLRALLESGELSLRDIEERDLGHLDPRLEHADYV